jgi:hypothetical protein
MEFINSDGDMDVMYNNTYPPPILPDTPLYQEENVLIADIVFVFFMGLLYIGGFCFLCYIWFIRPIARMCWTYYKYNKYNKRQADMDGIIIDTNCTTCNRLYLNTTETNMETV